MKSATRLRARTWLLWSVAVATTAVLAIDRLERSPRFDRATMIVSPGSCLIVESPPGFENHDDSESHDIALSAARENPRSLVLAQAEAVFNPCDAILLDLEQTLRGTSISLFESKLRQARVRPCSYDACELFSTLADPSTVIRDRGRKVGILLSHASRIPPCYVAVAQAWVMNASRSRSLTMGEDYGFVKLAAEGTGATSAELFLAVLRSEDRGIRDLARHMGPRLGHEILVGAVQDAVRYWGDSPASLGHCLALLAVVDSPMVRRAIGDIVLDSAQSPEVRRAGGLALGGSFATIAKGPRAIDPTVQYILGDLLAAGEVGLALDLIETLAARTDEPELAPSGAAFVAAVLTDIEAQAGAGPSIKSRLEKLRLHWGLEWR